MPASDSITSVEKLFLLFRSCQKIDALPSLRFFFSPLFFQFFPPPSLSFSPPLLPPNRSSRFETDPIASHAQSCRSLSADYHVSCSSAVISPGINTPNDLSKRIDDFATVSLCYRDQITQLAQNSSDDTTYHDDTYRATITTVYTLTLKHFRRFVNQWIKREWGEDLEMRGFLSFSLFRDRAILKVILS